jgi:hypothetical protein
MLQAVLVAAALGLAGPNAAEPQPPVIQACLSANLTLDTWPIGVFVLDRRFPDGSKARHIAQSLTPQNEPPAPRRGPNLMLVYELGERAPGALVQVSVTDVVIFGADSPTSAEFEILVDGVSTDRSPWPEYAEAAAAFRRTGAPRYLGVEQWPLWGLKGAPLRGRLGPMRSGWRCASSTIRGALPDPPPSTSPANRSRAAKPGPRS